MILFKNRERSACESTFDDAKALFDAKKQQKENAYDAALAANTEYNTKKDDVDANYVNAPSNIDTAAMNVQMLLQLKAEKEMIQLPASRSLNVYKSSRAARI